MFKQTTIAIALISAASTLAAYGCSSSTSGNTPPANDSGAPGAEDTGVSTQPTGDGSVSQGNDSGEVAPSDGGNVGTDSAPPAPACFAAPTGYTALTAAITPTPVKNACSSTDISAFITACISGTSASACDDWQTANIAGLADGSAGTACGNCIFPADSMGDVTNAGPTYILPSSGSFTANYAGCVQLIDSTNGAACGLAYDNWTDCDDYACGTCSSQSTYGACQTYADGTGQGCAAAFTSTQACTSDAADGGAFNTCQTGVPATDFTTIINLFCGTGDAGAP
jgi:hypothetical protein